MGFTKIIWLAALTMMLLSIAPRVEAHSWIERLYNIAPNGTFIGAPGYPRGNVLRTAVGFSDDAMVNLLPPNGRSTEYILPTDPMCMSSQTIGNQTAGSPKLVSYPGGRVVLQYQENGHVTLTSVNPGKPDKSGTIMVYATQQPRDDDKLLSILGQWNKDGTGGDGRGWLIHTANFDDGQCYQVNSGNISVARQAEFPHEADPAMGANLWCQTDVQIPSNVTSDKDLTLYWVWNWPTAVGTVGVEAGKEQVYTTCMDIGLDSTESAEMAKVAVSFAKGQSLNSAAVPEQFISQYVVTGSVTAATYGLFASGASVAVSTKTTAAAAAPSASAAGVFTMATAAPALSSVALSTPHAAAISFVTVTMPQVVQTMMVTVTETINKPVTVTVEDTSVSATSAASAASSAVSVPAAALSVAVSNSTLTSSTISSAVVSATSHPVVEPFITASASSSAFSTTTTTTAVASAGLRIRGRAVDNLRPLRFQELFN